MSYSISFKPHYMNIQSYIIRACMLLVCTTWNSSIVLWFIVKGCCDRKLTWIIGICMLLSPKSPNFITLGQGVHENGPSYIGHSKNEILGETPLNMT